MNPWNMTTSNLLSQHLPYPPHLFLEQISNMANSSGVTNEARGTQMTIFYGGQVLVFDDVQADKAKGIMSFATKGMSSQNQKGYAHTLEFPATNYAIPSRPFPFLVNIIPTTPNNPVQECPQAPPKPVICDLPLTRKASLHRFLEKRKDRIAAGAPYQTSNHMSWLTLAPKSPQQDESDSDSSSSFVLF